MYVSFLRGRRGRGERVKAEEALWIDSVITIFLCDCLLFAVCAYGEVNEPWLVTVHISLSVSLNHTHCLLFCLWFCLWKMYNQLQIKLKDCRDNFMLCSLFLTRLWVCGQVLSVCSSPTSGAALQALKKHNVACTRYITTSTMPSPISQETKLRILWPWFFLFQAWAAF